jgi:hypothetical protein
MEGWISYFFVITNDGHLNSHNDTLIGGALLLCMSTIKIIFSLRHFPIPRCRRCNFIKPISPSEFLFWLFNSSSYSVEYFVLPFVVPSIKTLSKIQFAKLSLREKKNHAFLSIFFCQPSSCKRKQHKSEILVWGGKYEKKSLINFRESCRNDFFRLVIIVVGSCDVRVKWKGSSIITRTATKVRKTLQTNSRSCHSRLLTFLTKIKSWDIMLKYLHWAHLLIFYFIFGFDVRKPHLC